MKYLKYIGAALAVALSLALLAACGELSEGDIIDSFVISDTEDADGFESVGDSDSSEDSEDSVNSESSDNGEGEDSESGEADGEDTDGEETEKGSSGGTVDLPTIPL